jgi:tripartite-type tricarboxylate transporter receptor subunit TctC
MKKYLAVLPGIVAALLTSGGAAQDWPKKPVRLIAPVAAGGGIDRMARILSDRLSQQLPQRVIVENMGGAGGLIAERTVAKGTPDGHILLFTGPSHARCLSYRKSPAMTCTATSPASRWSRAIHW